MSGSTSLLDLLSVGQSQKEVTANALFDALSPASLFGRRASTSTGLTFGYYGGPMLVAGVPTIIASGTIALTASVTNYLYATSAGVLTKVTSAPGGWPGPLAAGAIAQYSVVTTASAVSSWIDYRTSASGSTLPVVDSTAIVTGSSDATKQLKIEVDGFTTATTRTLTPQNKNYTIADKADLDTHITDTANPHAVTKTQVGLANVANVDQQNATNITSGTLAAARMAVLIGDAGSGGTQGAVPAPAAGDAAAGKFLKADGTFAVPSGGSDLPVADTTGIAKGSTDATKIVRFEVDGFTTATTRVLTPQDRDYTLADKADLDTHVANTSNPHTVTAAQLSDLAEAVDDRVATLLVAGTNVSLTYNDGAGTLTVDATPGGGGGTVSSVATGTGLTGGPITINGTISLESVADDTLLANTSGVSAAPVATTLSVLLDSVLGTTQGGVLYRGASTWDLLGPGTSGQFLKTLGAAANPLWDTPAGSGTVTSVDVTAPAAGITSAGGPITASGAITLALANDLAAVEGLTTTGFAKRTAADTWSTVTNIAAADFANQSANQVLAGPTSGGAAAPAFRALVAADIPTQPYDVGGGYTGAPTASAVLMRYPFPRTVIFASGLAPSSGVAGTAATAQTDFDLKKNGASVGTMRFAAAATVASFIMASQTTFAAGDILTVVAPASPDSTLADIGFSLAGTR